MHTPLSQLAEDSPIARDIDRIASALAHDLPSREDLRQEMLYRFLTLPGGRARCFYLARLRSLALRYWARRILDAPLDHAGNPILDRQTLAVGGLAELDRIHQRPRGIHHRSAA